jgi:Pentatricopeptide repeat domain
MRVHLKALRRHPLHDLVSSVSHNATRVSSQVSISTSSHSGNTRRTFGTGDAEPTQESAGEKSEAFSLKAFLEAADEIARSGKHSRAFLSKNGTVRSAAVPQAEQPSTPRSRPNDADSTATVRGQTFYGHTQSKSLFEKEANFSNPLPQPSNAGHGSSRPSAALDRRWGTLLLRYGENSKVESVEPHLERELYPPSDAGNILESKSTINTPGTKTQLSSTWSATISKWQAQLREHKPLEPILLEGLVHQKELGSLEPTMIIDSIWLLLDRLMRTQHLRSNNGSERFQLIRTQVTDVWSFAVESFGPESPKRTTGGQVDEAKSWKALWKFAQNEFSDMNEHKYLEKRFHTIFPNCPQSAKSRLADAAAATFACLIFQSKRNFSGNREFICFLGHLLDAPGPDLGQRAWREMQRRLKTYSEVGGGRLRQVLENYRLHVDIVMAFSAYAKFQSGKAPHTQSPAIYPNAQHLVRYFRRKTLQESRLGVTSHAPEALQNWTLVFAEFDKHWKLQSETPFLSFELARTLMKMTLMDGDAQAVGDVWKEMLAKGLEPDLQDFTLRIIGAGRLRQQAEVESFWDQLCQKWEPDQWAWGARIVAYINCNNPEIAMNLLEAQADTWIRAAKVLGRTDFDQIGSLPGAPKPRTWTINTILLALSRKGYNDKLAKVARIATGLGVQLDRISFNTMMNVADRNEGPKVALRIAEEMIAQGIRPGKVTYNILLNSIFRHGTMGKQAQWMAAKKILENMDSQNIPIGTDTLATFLKLMLWKHDDLRLGLEILEEAKTRFKRLDRVMMTVLASYLFTKPTDANFRIIKDIWNSSRSGSFIADAVFWGEMARGYASIDDVERMVELLSGMYTRRMKLQWAVLYPCLQSAVMNEQWEDVNRVVKVARLGPEGKLCETAKEEHFREEFWKLAKNHASTTDDVST